MLRLLLATAALLAPQAPASAAVLVPEQAVARALAASPALRAYDQAIDAARVRAGLAGAWPNPSVVTQVQLSPNRDQQMLTLGLRQPLDFRNLGALRRTHAEADVEALALARERTHRKVANEARQAYLHLWRDEAAVRAQERHVAFLEGELARQRRRAAAGAVAPHETLHVAYELASARLQRQAARHEAERERARLNFLWGAPADAAIALAPRPAGPPGPLPPLDAWVAEARAKRLELAEATTAIRREVHAANVAEALRFGEGELDLEAGTAGAADPLFYSAFALPVPLWADPAGGAAAARADAARLEAERVGLARAIDQEVADAYLACRQAAERLRETTEVLVPLAGHALERAVTRVRAGAAMGAEILEARKQQRDAENARLQATLDYDLALLRLGQAAGR